MSDMKNVGKKIRILRQGAEMTQEGLANRMGYSKSFISHVEAGTRFFTDVDLKKVAQILGIRPEELLSEATEVNIHFRSDQASASGDQIKQEAIKDFLTYAKKTIG